MSVRSREPAAASGAQRELPEILSVHPIWQAYTLSGPNCTVQCPVENLADNLQLPSMGTGPARLGITCSRRFRFISCIQAPPPRRLRSNCTSQLNTCNNSIRSLQHHQILISQFPTVDVEFPIVFDTWTACSGPYLTR
jgi:hypothetical protein